MSPTPARSTDNPAPLTTAASLVAVEGGAVLLLSVAELASVSGDRLTMGLTTGVFFLIYGLALLGCAWAVMRRVVWTRGPILLAQLIQLGLAWNMRSDLLVVAVVAAVAAVVVLAGMLHPASVAVLEESREQGG